MRLAHRPQPTREVGSDGRKDAVPSSPARLHRCSVRPIQFGRKLRRICLGERRILAKEFRLPLSVQSFSTYHPLPDRSRTFTPMVVSPLFARARAPSSLIGPPH